MLEFDSGIFGLPLRLLAREVYDKCVNKVGKEKVALITDGRFSGGTYGLVVGHIAPEAAVGGNIALIKEGDLITVDATNQLIEVELSDEELEMRRINWEKPSKKYKKGVLSKYSRICVFKMSQ